MSISLRCAPIAFRRALASLSGAVLALLLALPSQAQAAGATSQRDINPTGGTAANGSDGLRVWSGSNSQFQVNLGGSGQVYSQSGRPTGGSLFNSVYLRVDRGTNGTTRIYSNADNANSAPFTTFTQVSQSAISGAGTAASPWQVTTVLRPSNAADNGITVTIVDNYILPQSWFTRRVSLSGMPASGATIKLYQNVDTYLLGGDNGPGFTRTSPWNTTGRPDFVGVQKGQQIEALWHEPSSGTPLWDRYFSGTYSYAGGQICNGTNTVTNPCTTGTGNLTNVIDTNASTDNGMAAQWNVPSGASTFTAEYRVTFASSSADLSKAFSPATINAGGVSTLTFTITNRTTNSVASMNFTDTLPTGVVVAPTPNVRTSCPSGGALGSSLPGGMTVAATAGSGTIQVSGASINGAPANGQLACQVAVDVTSSVAGQHTNSATNISGLNNLANLVGNEVLTVVQPQLTAGKSVNGTLVAGQTGAAADGHYLVQVTNNGTGPTTAAINIVDTLPAGVSATAVSSAQGTVSCGSLPAAGTLTCTFTPASPIAVGGSATVRIDVAIGQGATGSITNTVAIAGGGDPDPLPTCPAAGNVQCAQVTTALTTSADVSVNKTVSNATPPVASNVTFTIALSNAGPSAAQAVAVNDLLPAGYAFVSATPSVGSYAPGTGVWTVGTLAAGANASLQIVATVNATGPYANTATATSTTPDPASGNNSSTVTPVPTAVADVSVAKTLVTAGPYVVGQTVAFSIVVTNNGPSAATGISVADTPTNLLLGTVGGACTSLPCTIANLAAGSSATISVSATIQAVGAFNNAAAANATQSDPVPGNNSSNAGGTAVAAPAWTLDKNTTSTPTLAGQTATYTFTVTNTGGVAITGITVADPLLPGLSCAIATLAPGASASCAASGNVYTLTQADVDAGQVVNTATASGTPAAGTLANATDTHTLAIAAAPSLTVAKVLSDAPTPIVLGSVLEYTVTATNAGNVTLTNVVVSDSLIAPNTITCATLAPGAECVLVGTYTVTQADVDAGQVVNTGTAESEETPPVTTPPVTTEIEQNPSLTVLKADPVNADNDGSGTVTLGDVLSYTVTATNDGNITLGNVVVEDAQLTPASAACATLAPGATCVLTGTREVVLADVQAGEIVNTATASSDQSSSVDSNTVTTTVASLPIEANDDVPAQPVNGGTGGTGVLNVLDNDTLNGQPLDLADIILEPVVQGPLTINADGSLDVAPNTPAGTYTVTYRICEAANPDNCDTATVTVTVVAPSLTAADDAASTPQNTPVTIAVLGNDRLDGGSADPARLTITVSGEPANGTVTVNDDGTLTYVPDPNFSGTDTFTYTICETLNPDNCATATVTVTTQPNVVTAVDDTAETTQGTAVAIDVLGNDATTGAPLDPASVTIVGQPANGTVSCSAGVCTYTPGALFSGTDSFTYQVCDVSVPTPVCATATVTVAVSANEAVLRVSKRAAQREVRIGDLVRYTVVVENVGDAPAVGASLIDVPPAGFTYVDGSLQVEDGDDSAIVGGTHPLRIDGIDVAVGERATVVYSLRVGAGVGHGVHTNRVRATAADGSPASNEASADVELAGDPLLDDSLIVGTVFDDRDGDGWQDPADAGNVRVQGGFAPGAYVAGSTTVDAGAGPRPEADRSAPLLHGLDLGGIGGRSSSADPAERRQVVVRQTLRALDFTDDFVLTTAEGTVLRMDAAGRTTVEASGGDAAKGLTAQAMQVTREIGQVEGGYSVAYVIRNAGVAERGIPGVRIASVEGLLMETDAHGRFHVVGIDGGGARGRNFILKVDPSTLPPGSTFTTENPRVRRITPGLPVRFDFGVRMPAGEIAGGRQEADIELGEVLFEAGSAKVREEHAAMLDAIAERVRGYGGGRIVVTATAEAEALALARAGAVRDALVGRLEPDIARGMRVDVEIAAGEVLVGLDESVRLGTLLFDTDKDTIRPQYRALIRGIAARLERQGGGAVAVVGRADHRGARAYNVQLGLRRAQAVYAAIAAELGEDTRKNVRVDIDDDPDAASGAEGR